MPQSAASPLDIEALVPYAPRAWIPPDADLREGPVVIGLYEALMDRPLASRQDIEAFLRDWSELQAALDQVRAILYIRMTCDTGDPGHANGYAAFVQDILPAVKPLADIVSKRYLAARSEFPAPGGELDVFDRAIEADVALFDPRNVRLQTEDELLAQEYQAIHAAMTIEFQGRERTLQEMNKLLFEPDRTLREAAWRAATIRRLEDRERIEDIFEDMISVRERIAANTGLDDFVEFQFRALHRFDYSPADCRAFHEAVEQCVVPVLRELLLRRREEMGLESLRPWDTGVDPAGRAPLRPFEIEAELIERGADAFRSLDPELGERFDGLRAGGLLDLVSRKGKAPGGYQEFLAELRKPFIFMNAVGLDDDVRTLLHEAGHAFHALAAAHHPLYAYRHAPIEFCEVASFGMEFLAGEHLDPFYGAAARARSRHDFFRDKLTMLSWIAAIDAFQHWLYTHPGHGRDERAAAWLEIHARFNGGVVDWSGLEEEQSCLWQRQLHLFEVPLYYIEYGIAQLGALQLWRQARQDPRAALANYKRALALGGSRPLPELFEAAGLRFDFSGSILAPLIGEIRHELENCRAAQLVI